MIRTFQTSLATLTMLWSTASPAQTSAQELLRELLSDGTRTQTAAAVPAPAYALRSADDCETGALAPAPDPDFGVDGLVLIGFDVDNPGNYAGKRDDSAAAAAVQPDGKLLVGGYAIVGPDDWGSDAALLRLLPDGQPDPDFGDGGRVLLGIRPVPGSASIADIAVLPDGRIVLFGSLCAGDNVCNNRNLFFARLHPDGSYDTSFDFNGRRILDFSPAEDAAALIAQPDGKLLGTGFVAHSTPDGGAACALVVRLNADGSNDSSFGSNGHVCLFSDGDPPVAVGLDFAQLPDGRILVAGAATHGGTTPAANLDMMVFRLLPDGSLDVSFGNQGWSFVAFDQGGSFEDFAKALALDAAGHIVLAGTAQSTQSYDMAVARLLPDGTPDAGFGFGGRALIAFDNDGQHHGHDSADGVSVLDDGRIFLGGTATRHHGPFDEFPPAGAAVLLHADGSLDPCFGEGGRWVQALPSDRDRGRFLALARGPGHLYLAGSADVPDPSSGTGSSRDFMIVGFGGLPRPDELFGDRFESGE